MHKRGANGLSRLRRSRLHKKEHTTRRNVAPFSHKKSEALIVWTAKSLQSYDHARFTYRCQKHTLASKARFLSQPTSLQYQLHTYLCDLSSEPHSAYHIHNAVKFSFGVGWDEPDRQHQNDDLEGVIKPEMLHVYSNANYRVGSHWPLFRTGYCISHW